MAKKLFEVEVPVSWEIVKDGAPGMIMLRLRHKPLAAVRTDGVQGGTTVLLAFSPEMATDLANDLLGRTATAPRPGKLDS